MNTHDTLMAKLEALDKALGKPPHQFYTADVMQCRDAVRHAYRNHKKADVLVLEANEKCRHVPAHDYNKGQLIHFEGKCYRLPDSDGGDA